MASGAETNGQARRPPSGREAPAAHASPLYGPLSRVYDALFARVFIPRVSVVVRGLRVPPDAEVLEIGAGTGGSLPFYPPHCRVTALDLSAEMLERARRKIERMGWRHIRLVEGDATRLPFPDDAFDYVMAFHMVTVVDDPERLVREVVRVCRPGGTVAVVNRFRSAVPVLDRLEKGLESVTRHWGWATLRQDEVFEASPLRVLGARHGGPFGLFTAVIARNEKRRGGPARGGA